MRICEFVVYSLCTQEISTQLVRKRFLPRGEIALLVMPRPKLMRIQRGDANDTDDWRFLSCALSVALVHHVDFHHMIDNPKLSPAWVSLSSLP